MHNYHETHGAVSARIRGAGSAPPVFPSTPLETEFREPRGAGERSPSEPGADGPPQQAGSHRADAAGRVPFLTAPEAVQKVQAMQTRIAVFRCPSDTGPTVNDRHILAPTAEPTQFVVTSNYVACNGGGSQFLRHGWSMTSVNWTGTNLGPSDMTQYNTNHGIFSNCSSMVTSGIPDGTSNTILIGERAWEIGGTGKQQRRIAASAFGVYSGNTATASFDVRTHLANGTWGINYRGPEVHPLLRRLYTTQRHRNLLPLSVPTGSMDARASFSSNHAGVANFVMATAPSGRSASRFSSIRRGANGGGTFSAKPASFVFQNLCNVNDGHGVGQF